MVKVAWKTIKGYGPYAYLQHSVKDQDGTVTSKHLAYLGKLGAGGLFPGHHLTISAKQAQGFGGGRVRVPYVSSELQENLKPQGQVLTQSIHAQVESGTPLKQVDTTLAFAQKSTAPGAKKELGATPSGAEPKAAKAPPRPKSSSAPGQEDQGRQLREGQNREAGRGGQSQNHRPGKRDAGRLQGPGRQPAVRRYPVRSRVKGRHGSAQRPRGRNQAGAADRRPRQAAGCSLSNDRQSSGQAG